MTIRNKLGVLTLSGAAIVAASIALSAFGPQQTDQTETTPGRVAFPASNADIKGDRLPVVLASFAPQAKARQADSVGSTTSSPVSQYAAIDRAVSPMGDKLSDDTTKPAAGDLPSQAKAKATPVKPPKPTNVVLNDAQIASLRERLKLTPAQQQFWPEIEVALRAVVKQIYEANKKAHGGTVPVDTTTPEVERLKTVATPLLMQMRPDQKAEIVMLARIIGMERLVAML